MGLTIADRWRSPEKLQQAKPQGHNQEHTAGEGEGAAKVVQDGDHFRRLFRSHDASLHACDEKGGEAGTSPPSGLRLLHLGDTPLDQLDQEEDARDGQRRDAERFRVALGGGDLRVDVGQVDGGLSVRDGDKGGDDGGHQGRAVGIGLHVWFVLFRRWKASASR